MKCITVGSYGQLCTCISRNSSPYVSFHAIDAMTCSHRMPPQRSVLSESASPRLQHRTQFELQLQGLQLCMSETCPQQPQLLQLPACKPHHSLALGFGCVAAYVLLCLQLNLCVTLSYNLAHAGFTTTSAALLLFTRGCHQRTVMTS